MSGGGVPGGIGENAEAGGGFLSDGSDVRVLGDVPGSSGFGPVVFPPPIPLLIPRVRGVLDVKAGRVIGGMLRHDDFLPLAISGPVVVYMDTDGIAASPASTINNLLDNRHDGSSLERSPWGRVSGEVPIYLGGGVV